jgi:hypothetical protein
VTSRANILSDLNDLDKIEVSEQSKSSLAAQGLGLNRSTVYGWLARYPRDGWNGLQAKPLGWQDDRKHLRCDEARCNSTSRPMVARLFPDKLGVKLRVASVERLLARAHGDLEQARFRRKSPVIYIMGQLQNDPKTTSILLPKATSPIRRQNVDLFIN